MAVPDMVHANLKGLAMGGVHTHTHKLDTDMHTCVCKTTQCIKHYGIKGISSEPLRSRTHIFLDTWSSILVCIKHGERQQERKA